MDPCRFSGEVDHNLIALHMPTVTWVVTDVTDEKEYLYC
jgi:hypothetical protein